MIIIRFDKRKTQTSKDLEKFKSWLNIEKHFQRSFILQNLCMKSIKDKDSGIKTFILILNVRVA